MWRHINSTGSAVNDAYKAEFDTLDVKKHWLYREFKNQLSDSDSDLDTSLDILDIFHTNSHMIYLVNEVFDSLHTFVVDLMTSFISEYIRRLVSINDIDMFLSEIVRLVTAHSDRWLERGGFGPSFSERSWIEFPSYFVIFCPLLEDIMNIDIH